MRLCVIILLFMTSCVTNEIGTVNAYDNNVKQKLTYKITSGNVDNTFTINNNGLITYNKQPSKNKYELTVIVTDDGKMWANDTYFQDVRLSDSATITILQSAWNK